MCEANNREPIRLAACVRGYIHCILLLVARFERHSFIHSRNLLDLPVDLDSRNLHGFPFELPIVNLCCRCLPTYTLLALLKLGLRAQLTSLIRIQLSKYPDVEPFSRSILD